MKLRRTNPNRRRAALITEAAVALAILVLAVMPLAYSFYHERAMLKRSYYRAVAMEVVDGEMEILAAGEWRSFPAGTQSYTVQASAATNLPPGEFKLTVSSNLIRLEWLPKAPHSGGVVRREARVK